MSFSAVPGVAPSADDHAPELADVGRYGRYVVRRFVSADALAVSTRTVRRYIAEGQLDAVRLGRKTLRMKVDSIERFIDARPVGNWR